MSNCRFFPLLGVMQCACGVRVDSIDLNVTRLRPFSARVVQISGTCPSCGLKFFFPIPEQLIVGFRFLAAFSDYPGFYDLFCEAFNLSFPICDASVLVKAAEADAMAVGAVL